MAHEKRCTLRAKEPEFQVVVKPRIAPKVRSDASFQVVEFNPNPRLEEWNLLRRGLNLTHFLFPPTEHQTLRLTYGVTLFTYRIP